MAVATTLPAQQFTVDQYHRMIEIGVLGEGAAVELIEGFIMLKGQTHENGEPIPYRFSEEQCLRMVADGIVLPAGLRVRVRCAIRIAGGEPEPDLAIVVGPVGSNDDHHPVGDEIAMVIQVSDSALAYDRGIKLRAYAGAEIPAYWIVNLVERQDEAYGSPKSPRTGTPHLLCETK